LTCSPAEIRKRIRATRQSLSPHEVESKSASICKQLAKSPEYRASNRIAIYLSNDNEAQPEQLLPQAWHLNKTLYLPILKPKPLTGLWFGRYDQNSRLVYNCYGIPEPLLSRKILARAWTLDLAFIPLVAFDLKGNRLGMGGGFYDRAFSYLHQRQLLRRPRLIGLAFGCQKVDKLPAQPWDIPLDGIITEDNFYRINKTS
jgi:5-formyltetrahydrofolate cyclo-ligase